MIGLFWTIFNIAKFLPAVTPPRIVSLLLFKLDINLSTSISLSLQLSRVILYRFVASCFMLSAVNICPALGHLNLSEAIHVVVVFVI